MILIYRNPGVDTAVEIDLSVENTCLFLGGHMRELKRIKEFYFFSLIRNFKSTLKYPIDVSDLISDFTFFKFIF